MKTVKRAKVVTIFGWIVVNSASIFAIMNRSKPFRFEDLAALALLNGMFLGFFWLVHTRMGLRDFKNIAENQSSQDPQTKQ